MSKRALFGLFSCWIALSAVCFGAYLESDVDSKERDVVPEPPRRIIPPPPDTGAALTRLIRRVEVGSPHSRYGLTVYPLVLSSRPGGSGIVTLDEALSRDDLVIREKGSAEVPHVLVRNDGRSPVFLMSGEIILGGKQNRIVRDDVLLPARSDFIDVSVYCGEQNRWRETDKVFQSGRALSPPSLRSMAAKSASQDSIWREIDTQLERAGANSSTRSYQELYEQPEVERKLRRCVSEFDFIPGRRTVGAVVTSGSRILGCDIFSDPGLFERLWPKICRSYAVDVIVPLPRHELEHWHDRRPPARVNVRGFLDRILSARFHERHTPGIGVMWRLSGTVSGNSLEHRGAVVHAAVFPERAFYRPTPPRPEPFPMPRPRSER